MSEFKVGGHQRFVIIPRGKAQNGWKVFGLELRKMLELDQYALGCSSQVSTTKENVKVSSLSDFCQDIEGLGVVKGRDSVTTYYNQG